MLIWELLTDSKRFPNLKSIPLNFPKGGYHDYIIEYHPRPDNCPDALWELLQRCLQVDIKSRPNIEGAQRMLGNLQRSDKVLLDSVDYA